MPRFGSLEGWITRGVAHSRFGSLEVWITQGLDHTRLGSPEGWITRRFSYPGPELDWRMGFHWRWIVQRPGGGQRGGQAAACYILEVWWSLSGGAHISGSTMWISGDNRVIRGVCTQVGGSGLYFWVCAGFFLTGSRDSVVTIGSTPLFRAYAVKGRKNINKSIKGGD